MTCVTTQVTDGRLASCPAKRAKPAWRADDDFVYTCFHSSPAHGLADWWYYRVSSATLPLNDKHRPRFAQEAALVYNIPAISWARGVGTKDCRVRLGNLLFCLGAIVSHLPWLVKGVRCDCQRDSGARWASVREGQLAP